MFNVLLFCIVHTKWSNGQCSYEMVNCGQYYFVSLKFMADHIKDHVYFGNV